MFEKRTVICCEAEWRDRAEALIVTHGLPCQRRVAHSLCTPPIRRTGSIPSCACACAGRPRGLVQSVGTCPGPQSWDSALNRPSPARETGSIARRRARALHTAELQHPNIWAELQTQRGQKSSEIKKITKIKKTEAEMSKPQRVYPHCPDPVFQREASGA